MVGRLIVKRATEVYYGSKPLFLMLNDAESGSLDIGEKLSIDVEPGEHHIRFIARAMGVEVSSDTYRYQISDGEEVKLKVSSRFRFLRWIFPDIDHFTFDKDPFKIQRIF